MSPGRRATERASRSKKRDRERRVRSIQRDVRRSRVHMTVVSGKAANQSVISLAHELQQCNSALLYADQVTLVSPRASILKSARDISDLNGFALLAVLANVAPKFFPDAAKELQSIMDTINSFPPRSTWTSQQRKDFSAQERTLIDGLKPVREKMHGIVTQMFAESGYDQLQDAIDAGILKIDDVAGAGISELRDDDDHAMILGYLRRIDDALNDGGRYPLFDADANELVRLGVEVGYFSPVKTARRLGADAAMAAGLFDRLPNFPHAKTREILNIRTELSGSLSAFRQGVRGLTEELDVPPESQDFSYEVEDAWNHKVAPALNEIEETIAQNKSMTDLMRRGIKDPVGAATLGGGIVLPATLAVAAGPAAQFAAAAGIVLGVATTAARAFIEEHREIKDAQKTQFYFLFGTNEKLGNSGFNG